MQNKIICTLGPSSFNTNVLKNLKKCGVFIFRINMSHTNINELEKKILFLKKNKIKNICIDTEGAQLRTTKVKKKFLLKKNKEIFLSNKPELSNDKIINLYPIKNLKLIKKKSKVYIGFDNLILRVTKIKSNNLLLAKVVEEGVLDSNKGVHVSNNLNLDALTKKDIEAIEIANKYKIKFYAMSFVNKGSDIDLLKEKIKNKSFIISKIETKNALKNLSSISKKSNALLIDRGDLSRYISIEKIPIIQESIARFAKKRKKSLYVATNLLETMIQHTQPTRAESHDIYSTLKQGVQGLVLAAETAIGNDPVGCVKFLKKCINNFKKNKIKKLQEIIR